jgi:cytochrome c oxidase subunit 3
VKENIENPMSETAEVPSAHHEHPAHLAHHFESLQQQYDSGKLGIWLFLTTEILMFSGLFCGYSVLRALHPEIFLFAHHYLSVELGALNTVVLLFSSFTMAWGVRAAQLGQTRLLITLLSITFACAAVFLGVKYIEYKNKWEEALLPGRHYNPSEPPPGVFMPRFEALRDTAAETAPSSPAKPAEAKPAAAPASAASSASPTAVVVGERSAIGPAAIGPTGLSNIWLERRHLRDDVIWHGPEPYNVQLFFGIYFAMTGLHGIHVIGGMIVIGWLIVKARQGIFGPDRFAAVDFVGLYWHLVDLVWIFLFPLLYLIS